MKDTMPMLSEEAIRSFLKNKTTPKPNIKIHDTLTSTMDASHKQPPNEQTPIKLILANNQTHGRGQQDKTWASQKGQGIYMTLALFKPPQHKLKTLSLSVGAALFKALAISGIPKEKMKIKWPNDLLISGKKVAGILIESNTQGKDQTVHIGIGCNLNPIDTIPNSCGLNQHRKTHNPNQLIATIVTTILHHIDTQTEQASYWHLLETYDALKGKQITIKTDNAHHEGTAMGIDKQGAIRLKTKEKPHKIISVLSGQIMKHPYQGTPHELIQDA